MKITKRIVRLVKTISEGKKAEDVLLLEVKKISSFCDFFVIMSGGSSPHLDAISSGIVETLKKQKKVLPHHIEGESISGWILLDYGNMIVHIFSSEKRNYYNLERLWRDAKIIE